MHSSPARSSSPRASQLAEYDIPGAILGTAGLVAPVYGFTQAGKSGVGWLSVDTIGWLVGAVILLVAFVLVPRHLPTVAAQPSRPATVLLSRPSAHASTIRDRNANACDDFARLDQRTSCARSSSVNTNSALGRPVLGIPQSKTYSMDYWRDTH